MPSKKRTAAAAHPLELTTTQMRALLGQASARVIEHVASLPDQPMHHRYQVDHDFLSPKAGAEAVTIGRLVNAFFRWEFNSCETLVKGAEVYPIDYANACPDVAVTSLHYYFP